MDYQALAQVLPLSPSHWNNQHVQLWLHFIHLPTLAQPFNNNNIHGQTLLSLNELQLTALGVNNNIIKRKITRWIKEGLPQFEEYLQSNCLQNKENLPPLQRKETTERGIHKIKPSQRFKAQQHENSMVIRSCQGSLASFYIMKEKLLKIGRSSANVIRSLEASVEPEHSQIFKIKGKHYLYDKGTQSGTFIKIVQPRMLKIGTLVEMGSFVMEVKEINKLSKNIFLKITHMTSLENCEVTITLVDGCNFYSFGRRKTNNFWADDEHLSGLHAKIYLQQGEFFIEDMHSTNGTWLRLSQPKCISQAFELEEGTIFKVGTTITYQCLAPEVKEDKMEIEYEDSCLSCQCQKRNTLFLPCKHNAVCSGCAASLQECPLCCCSIGECIKIYI